MKILQRESVEAKVLLTLPPHGVTRGMWVMGKQIQTYMVKTKFSVYLQHTNNIKASLL